MDVFKKGRLRKAEIYRWLCALRSRSYVPESGYAVAAVFRVKSAGADDCYFAGVNVENVDHRLSTHGEEGAISAIVTALGKNAKIAEGWVMGAPRHVRAGDNGIEADHFASCCGKCRQQIAGMSSPRAKIHYMSLNGAVETTTVGKFLPEPFVFDAFISGLAGSLVKDKGISLAAGRKKLLRKGPCTDKQISGWLKSLESVDYATHISQSVVLKLDNGHYVAGTRVEDVAFIDISSAQAAVAVAAAAFGAFKIEGAWVYTRGRDKKNLPAQATGLLPLSALQVLSEFAKNKKTPIRFLRDKGTPVKKTLAAAVAVAPVKSQKK